MKALFIITAIFFINISIYGQIPNGGFEDWESIQNFEKPVYWNTNQDSSFIRFEKDTFSVEGNYSLKIVPSSFSAWQECMSIAITGIGLDMPVGEGKCLTFHVKTTPDTTNQSENTFLQIRGNLYELGTYVTNYQWETNEIIDEFSTIEIPILNPNIDSLTLSIFGGAVNGATDGCSYRSYSWVDGIEINPCGISMNSELLEYENKINIYPNPSTGRIIIEQQNKKYSHYQIIDIYGRTVVEGELGSSIIKLESKGMFLIILSQNSDKSQKRVARKILIK